MNISTALSAVGSALSGIGSFAVAALPSIAPIAAAALMPKPKAAQGYGMPYAPTSFMPGSFGLGAPPSLGFASNLLGGALGPVTPEISTPMAGALLGTRYPKLLQQLDGNRVITYVRAPAVRYKVSVRPARRGCAGGR